MSVLAFGLSTGEILMSIPSIGLAVNWLAEGKFNLKWSRFKELHFAPLVFSVIYLIYILGLTYTSDINNAFKDLILKLPLLCFPIVLGSIPPIKKKEWYIIVASFITGLIISCTAGYWIYFTQKFSDYRELSIFISHIRLSLLIGIGVLLVLLTINFLERKSKFLLLIPLLYLAYFVRILESGTGYISLALAFLIFAFYFVFKLKNRIYFRILGVIILLGIVSSIFGIFLAYKSITNVKDTADKNNLEYYTPNGGIYTHQIDSELLENGYYVWLYVCREEVETSWPQRSNIPLMGLDGKGQKVYGTLYRYLTSKGLRKDLDGVMALTDEDVKNIENGIVTSVPRKYGVTARVKELIYEVITYKENADPNGHSLIQRMFYLHAGFNLFLNQPILGVSKGSEMAAYHDFYERSNSQLLPEYQLRAHNQFLSFFVCFGIIGGVTILFGLIFPILKTKTNVLTITIILFGILSFLSDDVLDTQAGVTFFSFFYCLFLFQPNPFSHQLDKSISS